VSFARPGRGVTYWSQFSLVSTVIPSFATRGQLRASQGCPGPQALWPKQRPPCSSSCSSSSLRFSLLPCPCSVPAMISPRIFCPTSSFHPHGSSWRHPA